MPPPATPSWVFPGEVVTSRMGGSVYGSATRWAIESITHRGSTGVHVRVIPIDHEGQAGWFPLDFFLQNFSGSATTALSPNFEADVLAGAYGGVLNVMHDETAMQVSIENLQPYAIEVGSYHIVANGRRSFRDTAWRHGTIINENAGSSTFQDVSLSGEPARRLEVRSMMLNDRRIYLVDDEEVGTDVPVVDDTNGWDAIPVGPGPEEEVASPAPAPTTKPSAEQAPPVPRRSQWQRIQED